MTAAPLWYRNTGQPPIFYPLEPDEPCPPHQIHMDEAPSARVMVRLRNGRQPAASWPVIGRPLPTRWTLTRDPFDITHWRRP